MFTIWSPPALILAAMVAFLPLSALSDILNGDINEDRVRVLLIERLTSDPRIAKATPRPDGGIDVLGSDGSVAIAWLDNLIRELRVSDPAAREAIVERFARSLIRTSLNADEIRPERSALRVTLHHQSYLTALADENLSSGNTDPAKRTISRPVAGELRAVLVVDHPHSVATTTAAGLREIGLEPGGAWTIAYENLRREAREFQLYREGRLLFVELDGYYENALMLLPDPWPEISKIIDGDPVVATPARGWLIIAPFGDRAALSQLSQRMRKIFETEHHPISDRLFRRENGGWTPL